jgi:hypothetical protein
MTYFHPDWLAHQRERWLPPHARRWLKPEMLRALGLPDPGAMRTAAAAPASPHDINEHERKQETERLRVQREIASLRLELALLRLGETWRRKANFNPNQPRVLAGNSDGGQWTDGGGHTDFSASRRRSTGGRFDGTPAQRARLQIAETRARDAIRRVREFDPSWKPKPSAYETVEGRIAAA